MREKWEIVREMAVKGTLAVPKERNQMANRDRGGAPPVGGSSKNSYGALHDAVLSFHRAVSAAQKDGWDVQVTIAEPVGSNKAIGTAIHVDVQRKLGPEASAEKE